MRELIEQCLNDAVRPLLHSHGGEVEVTAIEGGTVHIRLLGQCAGCASAYYTLDEVIEARLRAEVPGVMRVVLDDGALELYRDARALIRQEKGAQA